jgi:hypothetical protein
MNSLIFNDKVLVPIFTTEPALSNDAMAAYQVAMPDYEIVGIYSDAICSAGGAIHCTTIGIAEHSEDYVYDATITADPVSPPIQIPSSGGSFQFDAALYNNQTDSIFTEVWTEVTLPGGTVISPIFERTMNMPGSGSASRTLSQAVPPTAPAGTYTYTMYTGERLPRVVNDEASFTFEKLGVDGVPREDHVGWWTEEIEGSSEALASGQPSDYMMVSAYPNPFNPTTELTFNLHKDGYTNLTVYNVNGSMVAELVSGYYEVGSHKAVFDAADLSSGVYFAKLQTAGNTAMQKLVLLK